MPNKTKTNNNLNKELLKEKNMDEAEEKWNPTLDKIISNNKLIPS